VLPANVSEELAAYVFRIAAIGRGSGYVDSKNLKSYKTFSLHRKGKVKKKHDFKTLVFQFW
jgi:hypothetical protein